MLQIMLLVFTLLPAGVSATIEEQGSIDVKMPKTTDANYVVYVGEDADSQVIEQIEDSSLEKIVDSPKQSLYACDLNERQAQEINNSEESIIVEKNVEFSASATDLWLTDEAVDHNGQKTEISAQGQGVDIVAPGEDIGVESMFGMHTWADGTSLAAGHATAEASVLWQKDKSKSNGFVRGLMESTAKNLGEENKYGKGVLDIAYAQDQYSSYAEVYTDDPGTEAEIDSNTKQVKTFTEEDISLKGQWGAKEHIGSVTDVNDGNTDISKEALTVIKRGAIYPDIQHDTFKAWWHGSEARNYIACYRFMSKMATFAGDTSKISKGVNGLSESAEEFKTMKSQISLSKIGNKTWEGAIDTKWPNSSLIAETFDTPLYTGGSIRKTKLRKCFLYGMAMHAATDTYAHAAYTMRSAAGKIEHDGTNGGADNPKVCPNRFEDAKKVAQETVRAYKASVADAENNQTENSVKGIAGLEVFVPKAYPGSRGYYLGNLLKNATAADYGFGTSQLSTWFKDLNYTVN